VVEGALGVGGAYGKGRVYVHGRYVGDTTMGQVSIGIQAGGKVYSEIIFFEDKRALNEFESGAFEFAAGASAVAVTAGASATVGTSGASASMSAGKNDAKDMGVYHKGMAVFTIAKGGLMYAANLAGQKFKFTPRA
jgi:lipid-binding SYLF domain-containing protein